MKKYWKKALTLAVFILLAAYLLSGSKWGQAGNSKEPYFLEEPLQITCNKGSCGQHFLRLDTTWSPPIYIPDGYGPMVFPENPDTTVKVRINGDDQWIYTKGRSREVVNAVTGGVWNPPRTDKIQIMAADDQSIGKPVRVSVGKNQ